MKRQIGHALCKEKAPFFPPLFVIQMLSHAKSCQPLSKCTVYPIIHLFGRTKNFPRDLSIIYFFLLNGFFLDQKVFLSFFFSVVRKLHSRRRERKSAILKSPLSFFWLLSLFREPQKQQPPKAHDWERWERKSFHHERRRLGIFLTTEKNPGHYPIYETGKRG